MKEQPLINPLTTTEIGVATFCATYSALFTTEPLDGRISLVQTFS